MGTALVALLAIAPAAALRLVAPAPAVRRTGAIVTAAGAHTRLARSPTLCAEAPPTLAERDDAQREAAQREAAARDAAAASVQERVAQMDDAGAALVKAAQSARFHRRMRGAAAAAAFGPSDQLQVRPELDAPHPPRSCRLSRPPAPRPSLSSHHTRGTATTVARPDPAGRHPAEVRGRGGGAALGGSPRGVPTARCAERRGAGAALPGARARAATYLLSYSPTVLLSCCPTVLLSYCRAALRSCSSAVVLPCVLPCVVPAVGQRLERGRLVVGVRCCFDAVRCVHSRGRERVEAAQRDRGGCGGSSRSGGSSGEIGHVCWLGDGVVKCGSEK